ncbi:MAG: hypothetical protein OEV70_11675, partial [Nitrospirota bacterium]|nr:hypothetical protein [Nitrospirota bacterium]
MKAVTGLKESVDQCRQRRSRLLAAFGRTDLTLFASCALTSSSVRAARPTMVALFGMHQAIRVLPGRAFLSTPLFSLC